MTRSATLSKRGPRSASGPAPAQPARLQPGHQLARADRLGAGADAPVQVLGRHVVVVAAEAALGDLEPLGEQVQLRQALVADQVRPEAPAPGPGRRVDE